MAALIGGLCVTMQLAMLLVLQMAPSSITALTVRELAATAQDGKTTGPGFDVIPRHVALKSISISKHLKLDTLDNVPFLTFSGDNGNTRLETHRIWSYGKGNTVVIEAPNRHLWRRGDNGWILADQPLQKFGGDKACQFKLNRISADVVTIQSKVDHYYVKAYTVNGPSGDITFGLNAATSTIDNFCAMEVTDAEESAVTIPRFMFFKENSINGLYLAVYYSEDGNLLRFNFDRNDSAISGAFQFVPHVNGNMLLRSIDAKGLFWRRDNVSDWIYADSDYSHALKDPNCQFEPTQTGRDLVVLKAIGNGNFVKRYTETGVVESVLKAAATAVDDIYAQLLVTQVIK